MHAIVPPHPGPVAAATAIDANVGLTLLVGIPIAVAAWYVGVMLVTRVLGSRVHVPLPEIIFGEVRDQHSDQAEGEPGGTKLGERPRSALCWGCC